MNLSFIIFRIISGSALLVVGYITANDFFAKTPLFKIPFLGQTLVAFIAGAAGLYVIPYLVVYIFQTAVKWLTSLIQVTVQTTVARSMGSFFATQAHRIRRDDKPEHNENSRDYKNKILLDTSVIIDGRIFDVIRSNFLSGELIVPSFVISELQSLADSSDDLKRQRGRRGLNLLDDVRKSGEVEIVPWEGSIGGADVDAKLSKLAKKIKASLATVDYNLNKAASVSGVKVLNINDLANILKTVILPGEKIKVKIIQEGKEEHQGVGYLPDGTMIVVEDGRQHMGQEVTAEVGRLLQSSAGKMIFARVKNGNGNGKNPPL